MTPADFIAEFVDPALALWRDEPMSTLKAICAISQVDILAEVVANDQHGGHATPRQASDFRRDLGVREPILGRIRNAHDSHKHGQLNRPSAQGDISQGQRPRRHRGSASFAGAGFYGAGHYGGKPSTAICLNDGTTVMVGALLKEAMEAWDRELARLGIPR